MRMHGSVIEKIIWMVQNLGGHENDSKLRDALKALDFTPYERKQGNQELILVLTEDYMKVLNNPSGLPQ